MDNRKVVRPPPAPRRAAFFFWLLTGLFASARAQVVISELLYDPADGASNEFVEVYNAGGSAAALGNWRFTAGISYLFPDPTVLPPGGYLVICADRAAFQARNPSVTNLAPGAYSGQLNNGGEQVALADAATNIVFAVTYNNAAPWPAAAAGRGSSLVLLDPFASPSSPANWGASATVNGSPGGPGGLFVRDIVINEVLAHTDPPQEDAVELYNVATNAVDVSGWFLSDDGTERRKYRFPTNTVVPAGGRLVVYQDQTSGGAGALIPFSISSKGDDVFLSQGNTNGDIVRFVDSVAFGASKNGVSFGRHPDGGTVFLPLMAPTFGVAAPATLTEFRTGAGAPNVGPWVGPVVINEIMYHPATSAPPGAAEYIELLNASASPVPLYNPDYPELAWSLSGGIDYTFPTNLVLQPGQLLLVTGTNDLAAFRSALAVPTNVVVLGPWTGSLNNAGDVVRIRVPNSPEPPSNIAARYVEDEVEFDDGLPWPLAADGLGGALERTDPLAHGNTAGNWHSSPGVATPGRTNSPFVPPGSIVISEIMAVNRHTLADEEGDYGDWIELYNTRPYAVSLAGWHLTDMSSMPTQWTFPAVSIPAHGYLVVFADGKNRTNDITRLHTSFSLSDAGEFLGLYRADLVQEFALDPYPAQYADVGYGLPVFGNVVATPVQPGVPLRYLAPTNAAMLATNWTATAFDDGAWPVGTNGLGYDTAADYDPFFVTDLQALMLNKAHGVCVRCPVPVTNVAAVADLTLRLRFEDGFIAWLNGVPVASNNVPAAVSWSSDAPAARNETLAVQFATYDLTPFLNLLINGTNILAIQCLNAGTNSSDLLLVPELSLSGYAGSTSVTGLAAGYLSPATPAAINGTSLPGVAPAPVLSNPGGLFAGAVTVTATCADAGATLRYTTDGSEPTAASPVYAAPLTFTQETELRVRAFVAGLVPSPVAGAVYRLTFLGINEFLASNATAAPEVNDFEAYPDFIELYNDSTGAVDVSGYHLSDSPEQPFKWAFPAGATVPPGGTLLVWADGHDARPGVAMTRPFWPYAGFVTRYYHSNFKLSADAESVCLFSPNGSLIDRMDYGPQSVDISLGRHPDGAANWVYFGHPTAGTNNTAPGLDHNLFKASAVAIAPAADRLIVTGAVTVVLSAATNVTEIRYTTDGGIPTPASAVYTGAFELATSGVVRARAYAPGRHPGPVATRTFLRDARVPGLPMLAMTVDPKLLYDPVTGIYSNNLKEREVPGVLQFCTTPTNTGFQINAGFRLYSYNTFLKAQKPFTVYLDADYGDEALNYKLFPTRPVGAYDRFILRNGNDDWEEAFLRDTLGQRLLRGVTDVAAQDFVPCAIYLNAGYYGLINIQEKMDEMYCARNYGVPIENVDFFEMDGTATTDDWILDHGTDAAWNSLLAFIASNSLAIPANYAVVADQVDVEDVIDYVAGQVFAYDSSWFHNRKWWRDRNPGGKWRWCVTDMDRALLLGNVNHNTISNLASRMVVFRELLANAGFRAYAAQRLMAHLGGSFSTNRTLPLIDYEAARIRDEIGQHIIRYAAQAGIPNLAFWDNEIESIRNFARQRPAVALQHVANYFASGQVARLSIETGGGGGRVLANHVALATNVTTALAGGLPVHFTAVPDIGQVFVRWEAVTSTPVTLLPAGSVWRYHDGVTNAIPGWNTTGYDDSAWSSGPAQLGYGDGDEVTTNSYGPNGSSKYMTTYYRAALTIPNPAVYAGFQVSLVRDDGAVVYVNGQEVLRDNMPAGTVSISTPALSAIGGADESAFRAFSVSGAVFQPGLNVIAVEMHQNTNNSSDLSFDLALSASMAAGTTILTNAGPELDWIPRDGETIRAVFAPAGVNLLPAVIATDTTLGATGSPYYATGDIFVPSNTTFAAGPGVEILMPEAADLRVQGRLQLLGSSNAPVVIRVNTNLAAAARWYVNPELAGSNDVKRRWGGITFETATHTGELVHVTLRATSITKADPVNHKAAISAKNSALWMDGLDLDDCLLTIFVQDGPSTVLQNSRIHLTVPYSDGINVKRATYARTEGNEIFSGASQVDCDAIDYDGVQGGIIRGNHLHDFMGDNDDAIDTGEGAHDLLIESNLLARFADKGISVGQGTTVIARRNIIRDCGFGAGIKDAGSYGLFEYNTFHQTQQAIALYEKNRGKGGGTADIRNNIFSETGLAPVSIDGFSTATVSFCLSDQLPVAGVGNLSAQPQFLNAGRDNFALQAGSAAIDAATPGEMPDPDGSPADLGAVPFDWRDGHVMISEIHYHPADPSRAEFVELHNPGGASLDLSGYRFTKGFEFTFPPGAVLTNGAYLVVAAATNGLDAVTPLHLWTNGTLDNAGEIVELHDAQSNEIDRVAYGSFDPWPAAADGLGPSLSVINPRRDNSVPANWYASGDPAGTPGGPFDNQFPGPVEFSRGAGGALSVSFDGLNNLLYTLEFTPQLIPAAWQPVQSAAGNGSILVLGAASTNATGIFRVRAVAP